MLSKTNDIFKNLQFSRPATNIKSIDVEVRDDEEQLLKLDEIIDILVNAGYFRAKIKGLSPFDKVVGGMTWCIESCNVDVDVDILFQENSTIGQKIALTEKIVALLPRLKCPHQLEPHQIQGLDFIHIYPVVLWLVKRSMEFRQEISEYVISYAVSKYDKAFSKSKILTNKEKTMVENIKKVNEKYRPQRVFKRINTLNSTDVNSEINLTLMEYEDLQLNQENKSNQNKVTKVSKNESIFGTDEIYCEDKEIFDNHYKSLSREFMIGEETFAKEIRISSIKEQISKLSQRMEDLQNEDKQSEQEINSLTQVIEDLTVKHQEANKALNEMSPTLDDNEKVKKGEELVILYDKLKKQEFDFREHCKQEQLRLQNLIKEAQNSNKEVSIDEIKQTKELHEAQKEKLKTIRLHVAKKNRSIALLQRQFDDVPNHAELAQYQRRFLELYNQISAKHKETKQYYSFHNSLQDTRFYMEKELSILNSIAENYVEAMLSKSGREQFLQQFEQIISGVKASKKHLENRLEQENKKKYQLKYELQCLLDLQRKYVIAVKELRTECQKHESLLAK